MSRQNKVNPGMYTQRGRLTQDDAARELRKQSALGSQHTWQPVKKNAMPRLPRTADAGRGTEKPADDAGVEETSLAETSATVETPPASRVTKRKIATKAAPAKLSKTAQSRTATKAAGKANAAKSAATGRVAKVQKPAKAAKATKAAKAAKPAARRAATTAARKAVVARNVGRPGTKARTAAKRPKR